jgi:hypothetical protein
MEKIDNISMLRNNSHELLKIVNEIRSKVNEFSNDYELGEAIREYINFLNSDGYKIYDK